MLLRSLALKDVGPFDHIELEFKRPTTVLVGKNGSGKSTVLRSIIALWSNLSDITHLPRTKAGKELSGSDITITGGEDIERDYHRQYSFPVDSTAIHNGGGRFVENERSLVAPNRSRSQSR